MDAYWTRFVAWGQIVAVCFVLTGSVLYQFVLGELPCPLCVMQRLSFLLACVGPILILRARNAEAPSHKSFDARCFALTIFASLAGGAVSGRQILLHIVPPDPGYGPPVLHVHLYTWALIVFVCLIISSAAGVMDLVAHPKVLSSWLVKGAMLWIMTLAVVIVTATFVMEGFHKALPGDPKRYELLHQLRITH
ncbi:MAG: disulfide bond formation protein B [Chthoniobacterales bacterium]